jgi:hypothetical protein
MRFSAVFQLPLPLPSAAQRPELAAGKPVPAAPEPPSTLPPDLPEELDARVRMIGEWQLGEG